MSGTAAAKKDAFPRLIELINVRGWPKPPVLGSIGAPTIIGDRLRSGLDFLWELGERWNQWDGRWNIYDHTKAWGKQVHRTDIDPRRLLEERWARAITELLLAAPYNGPDIETGIPLAELYRKFEDANDPVVAITVACQMSVTYGVLSRGHSMAELNDVGIDCGDQSHLKAFKGRWRAQGTNLFKIAYEGTPSMRPGSIHGWIAMDGTTKLVGSHTVFMLRTDPARAREQAGVGSNKAQVLDTGAAIGFASAPRALEGFPKPFGTFDYAEMPAVPGVITDGQYKGMGVADTNDAQLEKSIARLAKVRPLGLARIVLAREPFNESAVEQITADGVAFTFPKNAMFVSRLCRMWGADPKQNFPLSRYHFALRSLPNWEPPVAEGDSGVPTLAFCLFYCPRGGLARALLSARAPTLAALHRPPDVDVDAQRRLLMIIRTTPEGEIRWVHQSTTFGERGKVAAWLRSVAALPFDFAFSRVSLDVPAELNDGTPASIAAFAG